MNGTFHLFVYGTLKRAGPASALLADSVLLARATVGGTLYRTENGYPALMLAGAGKVHGEVWRCPWSLLRRLDEHEGVQGRLFRRVGVQVRERACWTYVAGPALARQLTPERRIPSGLWSAEATQP